MSAKLSIHAKRYYRVVLEGFDPKQDNADSFSLKLSMRTRTTLPRARQAVRAMPCSIKQGVDVAQANKLKDNIEGIGGRVRVESYLVTPGEDRPRPVQRREEADSEIEVTKWTCPSCDWEEASGSAACPCCDDRAQTHEEIVDAPDDAPAEPDAPIEPAPSRRDLLSTLRANKYLVLAGLLVILLAIAIFKQ
jgi:rubrerythrin